MLLRLGDFNKERLYLFVTTNIQLASHEKNDHCSICFLPGNGFFAGII